MPINNQGGSTPTGCASRIQKPTLKNIKSCQQYAHELVKHSSQPNHTLAHVWTRFLIQSYLQPASYRGDAV